MVDGPVQFVQYDTNVKWSSQSCKKLDKWLTLKLVVIVQDSYYYY